MCNQCEEHLHHHDHGRFDRGRLGRFRPIGRRTFLATVGKGTFAVLTEASVGRGVIAVALGSTGLAACAAPPAAPASTSTTVPTVPAATDAPTAAAAPTLTAAATTEPTTAATVVPTTAAALATLPPVDYQVVNLGFVNAYVLVRGNEVAVVDTGVAGSQDKIEEVIKAAGRSWGDVRHVILTHYHPDHAGSMDAVMAAAAGATGYAGAEDIPQIRVSMPLQAVADGAEVFGLQIVATPGHTPGHISVFDPLGSALIAGDALNNDGALSGPNPRFSADMATANQSVQKIAGLSFERAFFGHGSPLDSGASAAIAQLAATLQ